MDWFSDYRYAQIENDLIIVSLETNVDSPKAELKLIQNGITLDTQYKMYGKFSLIGKAAREIEVKVNQGIFSVKYQLFINGTEHVLNKIGKREALQMIERKKDEMFDEIESFDKTNAKIFPILKPGNWNALNFSAHKIIVGDEKDPHLVIAYGYNLSRSFSFLTIKDLESKNVEDIHKEAIKNIDEYPVNMVFSNELTDPILFASGEDFSAEKLISESFLHEAQNQLNSRELIISIPRRRCIMICSKAVSRETMEIFVQLHNQTWNDDSYGNAQIFNGIFLAKDGAIHGVLPLEFQ